MTFKDIIGLGMAIVVLAIVATMVQSQYTSGVIGSLTGGFAGDIAAAKKNG